MFASLSGGRNDQNQSVWNFELYLLEFICYLNFVIWCLSDIIVSIRLIGVNNNRSCCTCYENYPFRYFLQFYTNGYTLSHGPSE